MLTNTGGIQARDASFSINLAGFAGDSIVDGPGLRCTIFCQGCPHGCQGCHNPGTHPFNTGTNTSIQSLYAQIQSYPLCKGVTFSGGEPFCQAEGLCLLASQLKKAGYELAAYTGYTFEALLQGTKAQLQLLSYLDVLVDGPYIEAQRNLNLRFRGSENQRILNVAESLQAQAPVFETTSRWTGQ